MKELILYHRSDLDGHCSGAIAKMARPEAELFGIEYGDPIPWDKIKDASVIMVDFSLQPWSEMQRLDQEAADLLWIDHHKSAIEEYTNNPINATVALKEGEAACEIAWRVFNLPKPLPRIVYLLGRYDVWDLDADPDIMPFQMGMRLHDWNPANQLNKLSSFFDDNAHVTEFITDVINNGQVVLSYQKQCNERLMSKAFNVYWKGLNFLAVNAGGINSQAFDSKYDPIIHQGVMSFFYTGEHWTFSLYSPDQSIDLSGLAKEMGGGGHPSACGFQVNELKEVINQRRVAQWLGNIMKRCLITIRRNQIS